MIPLKSAELHPRHVQRAVERARRVAIHGDGLVVGELPVRPLAPAVAVPRGYLGGAGGPREAAVAGAAREQGDLERRRDVERLADEVRGAAGRGKRGPRGAPDGEAAPGGPGRGGGGAWGGGGGNAGGGG